MKNFSFFVRISLFCRYISVLFIKILISVAFLCIFFLINSVRQSIKVYNESVSLFLVLVLAFCRLRIFVGSGFVFSDDLSKSLYISQIIKSIKSDVGACLTSSTNPSPTLLFILLFVLVFKIIIFIIFLRKNKLLKCNAALMVRSYSILLPTEVHRSKYNGLSSQSIT